MGRLHFLSVPPAEGGSNRVEQEADVPIDSSVPLRTLQRDSAEAYCFKAPSPMLEPGASVWGAPASARRLCVHIQRHWGESSYLYPLS